MSPRTFRVLDLCSGVGGAGEGWRLAGADVTAVDIIDQPRNPHRFIQADAVQYLADRITSGEIGTYDLVHLSTPCQAKCALTVGTNRALGIGQDHVDLLPAFRQLLPLLPIPYVIEQPIGQAGIRKDVTLCGEYFGLGVLRHRNFELGGWTVQQPEHPKHKGRVRGYRHGVNYPDGVYLAAYGSGGGKATVPEMQQAMGITWTDVRKELTEAIPPAYTRWLGEAFLARTVEQPQLLERSA